MSALLIYQNTQALCLTLRGALSQVSEAITLGQIPESTLNDLRSRLSGAQDTARTLRAELASTDFGADVIPQTGDAVLAAWRWQHDTFRALLELDANIRAAQTAVSALVVVSSKRQVLVRSGDTLQRIAARELGDFRRWEELLSLNTLTPGDVLPAQVWVPV